MPCGTPSIGAQRWARRSCLCLPIAEADSILGFFLYLQRNNPDAMSPLCPLHIYSVQGRRHNVATTGGWDSEGQRTCHCSRFSECCGVCLVWQEGKASGEGEASIGCRAEEGGSDLVEGWLLSTEDGSPGSKWAGGASDVRCREHLPVPPHHEREKEAWEWDVMCPGPASQPVCARVGCRPLVPWGLRRPPGEVQHMPGRTEGTQGSWAPSLLSRAPHVGPCSPWLRLDPTARPYP